MGTFRRHQFHIGARGGAILLTVVALISSSAVGVARAQGTSRVRSQATISQSDIAVSPTVEFVDGVIRGKLNAVSVSGQQLAITFVGSSHGGKMDIGNVPVIEGSTTTDPQSFTVLPYATWLDASISKKMSSHEQISWFDKSVAKGTQTFTVRVGPVPRVGLTAKAALKRSVTVNIPVNLDALTTGGTPFAFTYGVNSFDKVKISANFIPAAGLSVAATAETVLGAPELGLAGITNPYATHGEVAHVPGPDLMRRASGPADTAYNVVTWDSRGTYGSGGRMQFGNPFFEGRDVSELIDWVASSSSVTLNGTNDPAIGIFGASLGGATALVAAATDPRVDAVIPTSSWTSLDTALSPNGIFHSTAGSLLLSRLKAAGVRTNSNIVSGITQGLKSGELSDETRVALASSGPSVLFHQLQAPTFLIQNSSDVMNRLEDSLWNAQEILDNPYGVPVKIAWLDSRSAGASAVAALVDFSKKWFNKYVVGTPIPDAYTPNFQWWDQNGTRFTSNLFPFSMGFNKSTPTTASSVGGTLKFRVAKKGVVKVTSFAVPVTLSTGSRIAGAPSVTFNYSGTGTAPALLARLVNSTTGAVMGPITTPIPVTLDGTARTVNIRLADIAYSVTSATDGNLALQFLSWAKPYSKRWSGRVVISNVNVAVPIVE